MVARGILKKKKILGNFFVLNTPRLEAWLHVEHIKTGGMVACGTLQGWRHGHVLSTTRLEAWLRVEHMKTGVMVACGTLQGWRYGYVLSATRFGA